MASKAPSMLNLPLGSESTSGLLTASKINVILSSDHALRKSSLKYKASSSVAEDIGEREKSKSVRWKEGTDLEDVMLIPPRTEITDTLSSQLCQDEMQLDYPLLRDSSNPDLLTFRNLKPDCDLKLKEFVAALHSGPESLNIKDIVTVIAGHETENQNLELQGLASIKSHDHSISGDEFLNTANSEGSKLEGEGPSNNYDDFTGVFSAGDLMDSKVPDDTKRNDFEATAIFSEGPMSNLKETEKSSAKPLVAPVEESSPPVTVIKAKPNQPIKQPFTKPTLRYSEPPFEYNDVDMSSFLEMQESFSSMDPNYSHYHIQNSKTGKGKFYVLYTEDTDYNFLCLEELFKEVSRSLRFGTRMPSEKTTGCMIDDLQTEFKPAIVDAPYGFNPTKDQDWMNLGVELSMVKYTKVKDISTIFPLTDLNFKELIMTGDTIGPLENYMLVNENYLKSMDYSSLDDMMPSHLEIHENDLTSKALTEERNKLKIVTGSPYRFPKLIAPSHTPHPEVARRQETNVHVVMEKNPNSPPPSPLPEEKPFIKLPVEIKTIYAKQKTGIPPQRESDSSIPKARRLMLAKCRAKTNLSISSYEASTANTSDFTDDYTSRAEESQEQKPRLDPKLKYRPRAGDYSTYIKSTHWNPTPQLVTKQTKMSLFKQILTEEEVTANTNSLNYSKYNPRPVFTVPTTLYADLMEHNNTIVLSRQDVLELIGSESEVPKYYTNSLSPGIYIPCAPPTSNPPHDKETKCKQRTLLHLPKLTEHRNPSFKMERSIIRK